MNIKLTDYSVAQLRLFSGIINKEIVETKDCIEATESQIPPGEIQDDLTREDKAAISDLREFHVHLLTALSWKVEADKVLMN